MKVFWSIALLSLAFILSLFALLSASEFTSISAEHQPLYRAEAHTSTITAKATSNRMGIHRITLTIIVGEMTDCTENGGPPSVIPCRKDPSVLQHVCTYSNSLKEEKCSYPVVLQDKRMVTYVAETENGSGDVFQSEEITYAGGTFALGGVARPVWWHKDLPFAAMIDIGFFPDQDYGSGNYLEFTKDLDSLVRGVFLNTQKTDAFAATYTKNRRGVNIWAGPFGANASPSCYRNFTNTNTAPIIGVIDGRVILHKDDFKDCGAVALGGGGTVNTSGNREERPELIFVHESGHFLHGQGDEYPGGGHYVAGDCANIFQNQAACEASPAHNNTTRCERISSDSASTSYDWWRGVDYDSQSSEELYDIMKDVGDDTSWQTDCAYCFRQRFSLCRTGYCY